MKNEALGPQQAAILEALADGSHSLAALVARIDRDRPQVVTAAVERLRQRHLVTVGPRRGRSMTGAMVALAESRTPSTPPTRGPAGDDVRRLSPWSRP